MTAANVGADAEVPPTGCVRPPVITSNPSPNAATSGVARPVLLNKSLGGNCGATLK